MRSEVAQLCLTLCDPIECSPPGSSIHGIFQARILEWVALFFSRGSPWPRDWTQVSRIVGRHLYHLSHQGSPKKRRVLIQQQPGGNEVPLLRAIKPNAGHPMLLGHLHGLWYSSRSQPQRKSAGRSSATRASLHSFFSSRGAWFRVEAGKLTTSNNTPSLKGHHVYIPQTRI